MNERDNKLGLASYMAHGFFEDEWEINIGDGIIYETADKDCWIHGALAAVAEARKIDTCDTCRLYGDGMSCKIINAVDPNCQLRTCEFGCNRHEPKEGE